MLRRIVALVGILGLYWLAGCGWGGTPPGQFDLQAMRGNWLVVGVMPDLGIGGIASLVKPGVAMSLDVVSGQIVGAISLQIPCVSSNGIVVAAIGSGTELEPVTPNADGTFVMEDVLLGGNGVHQVVIMGSLPQSAGGAWSGTYTLNTDTQSGVCSPVTGNFTAIPFSQLTGTYSGTGTFSGSSTPVTMTAVLTQGGPSSVNTPVGRVNSENLVSGTVAVQGSACFTSGAIVNNTGALIGNTFLLQFKMNDGSMLNLNGSVVDVRAGELAVVGALVSGGACDKASGFLGAQLQKQ